jgi:hypothetical protein
VFPPHPLEAVPAAHRRWFFGMLLVATAAGAVTLSALDAPLRTEASPWGIVSFELAGSVERAGLMIESWDERARLYAAFSLGFDFLYLVLYSTTLAFACVWGARVFARRGWPLAGLGAGLAWGQWGAAGLDALENAALWRLLAGPVVAPWPEFARWCATPKFALVLAGLLYAATAAVVALAAPRE